MCKLVLWCECVLLFVGIPVAVRPCWGRGPWLLLLAGVAVGAALWLIRRGEFSPRHFWHGESRDEERRQFKAVCLRFVLCGAALVAAVHALYPEKLFSWPRHMPFQWAALLLLYPVFSVYPQELLYRAFFARRYRALFPRLGLLVAASALTFGWMNLIFRNPLAVALTLVGGYFFAQTYARTRSLRLVCLEHALYGNLIFTVGLGEYFHQGNL